MRYESSIGRNEDGARFLCENARHFCESGWLSKHLDTEHAYYYFAISIELSLKAMFRSIGKDDDWTRFEIGHDLGKATHLVMEWRLLDLPDGYDELIKLVHPHYMKGGFRRPTDRDWPEDFLEPARSIVLSLNDRVRRAIFHTGTEG